MPDHEDSLGGETFSGEEQQGPAEQSLGDGATMGDGNVDDELLDDGMKLEDLSERYTEEGVLGKGGMGEVILATDTRLGRKVAIKRILGKAARSKTAVARFLTEAKSMAELSHPNIVQIYDYGRSVDGPFLIMECIQGGSLLDKCKAGSLDLDEAVNLFGQLCDGLAKAHAANIIHRDIKPANVLMTEDGVPKLTDFGLAKDDTTDTGMTMDGAVIGTLDFMPPEQRQAAELTDRRSDLWSLAATFYQMLTGKSPKIIKFSDVPAQLQDVLGTALEDDKEDRFQSALELKEAVQQAATAGLNASRDLDQGECPSCGMTNPSDRKFCRNADCAASLEVACLSCKIAIPMWEAVCGDCGTKQKTLIDNAKEALQGKHDEAEAFLNELKFDDALKAASVVGEQDDLRLQQFTAWHEEFAGRLEASRTSEHARLGELLKEAHAHEQAYDYKSGLQTLGQVALSLKQTTITGIEDTADDINERLTTKQTRLKELEALVRERVTKRAIGGLLPLVNELLSLKPNRPEVQKLKNQLEKRDADLLETRDAAVKQVTQELEDQQYAEALATLNTVSEEVWNEQLEDLKTKASDLLSQLNDLRDQITSAIEVNQHNGLLSIVEECLALKAAQDDLVKLKEQLEKHEADLSTARNAAIKQVTQQLEVQQYAEAVATLNTVSEEVWNEQLEDLKTKASDLLNQLNDLRDQIASAIKLNQHNGLLSIVAECLALKAAQDDLVKLKAQLEVRFKDQIEGREKMLAGIDDGSRHYQLSGVVPIYAYIFAPVLILVGLLIGGLYGILTAINPWHYLNCIVLFVTVFVASTAVDEFCKLFKVRNLKFGKYLGGVVFISVYYSAWVFGIYAFSGFEAEHLNYNPIKLIGSLGDYSLVRQVNHNLAGWFLYPVWVLELLIGFSIMAQCGENVENNLFCESCNEWLETEESESELPVSVKDGLIDFILSGDSSGLIWGDNQPVTGREFLSVHITKCLTCSEDAYISISHYEETKEKDGTMVTNYSCLVDCIQISTEIMKEIKQLIKQQAINAETLPEE